MNDLHFGERTVPRGDESDHPWGPLSASFVFRRIFCRWWWGW